MSAELVPVPVPGTDRQSWAGVVMMSTPSAGGDQQTAMIDRHTEADRPLFDSVWARHYANVVAESARGGDAE